MEVLFKSIMQQADIAMSWSMAGFGAILFVWSRIYGVVENKALFSYRFPAFLILPFVLFLLSVIFHYLLGATITGFNWELISGHTQNGDAITDTTSHFNNEYGELLNIFAIVQLYSSVVGIFVLSLWFLFNVLGKNK